MAAIFENTREYENGKAFRQEELENYYIDYIEAQSKKHIVIVFEGLRVNTHLESWQRYPWGGKFIYGQGISVIGVKCKQPDWFRGADLHLFFMSGAFQALLKQYEKIYLYGNSMGGYATLALAGTIPGVHVLCCCPQSTLDSRLVPWDRRFPMAKERNWDGYFGDAAKTLDNVGVIYAIYDPFFPADKAHIARLPQDKLVHLKVPFFQHDVAAMLLEMDLLKDVFTHFIAGDLATWFPQNLRGRRDYLKYLSTLFFHWALRCYKKGEYERAKYVIEQGIELCPGNRLALMLLRDIDARKEFQWADFYDAEAAILMREHAA